MTLDPSPSLLPLSNDPTLRVMQELIHSLPKLRTALPELIELRDAVECQGPGAIHALAPQVRTLLIDRLRLIPRSSTSADVDSLIAALRRQERRQRSRQKEQRNIVSTPTMYAAEISLEEFEQAAAKKP